MRFPVYTLLPTLASAAAVNHTIDDVYGDSRTGLIPTYLPPGAWKSGSTCMDCGIYPASRGPPPKNARGEGAPVDESQAFAATWHDVTAQTGKPLPSVVVHFSGQAVYVFNMLVNRAPRITIATRLVFKLNDTVVGTFNHTPDPSAPQLVYRVPVYVNKTLPQGDHVLVVSVADGHTASLVLFDYIIYTTLDDTPQARTPTSALPRPTTALAQPISVPTPSSMFISSLTQSTLITSATQSTLMAPVPPSILPLSRTPSASPTSIYSSGQKPTIRIAIVAVTSVLGTALVALAVAFLVHCYKRRRRMHRSSHKASPSDMRTVPEPVVPVYVYSPSIRLSKGFSIAATRADSRYAPGSSPEFNVKAATPSPTHTTYSSRARLLAKIAAASSASRVSRPTDPPCKPRMNMPRPVDDVEQGPRGVVL